jgi:chemotaxis protein CheD
MYHRGNDRAVPFEEWKNVRKNTDSSYGTVFASKYGEFNSFAEGLNKMGETLVKIMECVLLDSGVLRIDRIGVGVGVILYSPIKKKAAGIHILAPVTTEALPPNPAKYANTAIPHALKELEKKGINPPFTVAFAGGAEMQNIPLQARMGQKVITALREALQKAKLSINQEDAGGSSVRSMTCNLEIGKITIAPLSRKL